MAASHCGIAVVWLSSQTFKLNEHLYLGGYQVLSVSLIFDVMKYKNQQGVQTCLYTKCHYLVDNKRQMTSAGRSPLQNNKNPYCFFIAVLICEAFTGDTMCIQFPYVCFCLCSYVHVYFLLECNNEQFFMIDFFSVYL